MAATGRLPCGTSVDDLLAQVADGAPGRDPEHQRSCQHCRAALAELQELWAPVHALAADDVRAPGTLLQRVMSRVRALPRSTWYAVIPTDQGETRIAARVVGAVARLAAEEVPGVSIAMGSGRTGAGSTPAEVAGPAGEAATDVAVVGSHVVVEVQVVITMGTPIPATSDHLRAHVRSRMAQLTGLTAAQVDVTIVDVRPAVE